MSDIIHRQRAQVDRIGNLIIVVFSILKKIQVLNGSLLYRLEADVDGIR